MDFKKLLAVSTATLILSACGSDSSSPIGGGVGSAGVGGGGDKQCIKDLCDSHNEDIDESIKHDNKTRYKAVVTKLKQGCTKNDADKIADSACFQGTFIGRYYKEGWSVPSKCTIKYTFDGTTGTNEVNIGELQRAITATKFFLKSTGDDNKHVDAKFQNTENHEDVFYYLSDMNTPSDMSVQAYDTAKNKYRCILDEFKPE